MRDQGWNVFAALPQWWQKDGEHIQTIVEVTAKFASLHHLRQVPIRSSHQPHVHLVSPSAAQAFELLFLQYAQQLGLQRRRNITHLVEEECTFVGQLETANLLRYGSGERALLVAKELTFQQIQWNCSAIQSYKRTSDPRADVVDRMRDELLAGARFSLDENCGTRRRDAFDLFKHRFQCRTIADDLLEPARIRILITSPQYPDSCHREPPCTACTLSIGSTLQSYSDTLEQGFIVEWFCHELHRACS